MADRHQLIEWFPSADGGPLGRNVHHDPRSLNYLHPATEAATWSSQLWRRHVPVYDQGQIGDCTANAICGAVSTGRFRRRITSQRTVKSVYHAETLIDGYGPPWPPNDRGSSGLAAAKIAQQRGWITRYEHCTTVDAVVTALQTGPVIAGTNWLTGMDRPDSNGLVHATGDVRGGHEYELNGVDVDARTFRACNSWGASWGPLGGYFLITWADFDVLLHQQGDATVPLA